MAIIKRSKIKKPGRITSLEMELVLYGYFERSAWLIVPNVSHGMGLHECDLLLVTKSGYAWEIEIKTSRADLVRDLKKRHMHESEKIKHLYFAVTKKMDNEKIFRLIPDRAGIIVVYRNGMGALTCSVRRPPKDNGKYKFTIEERAQFARLGALRIWSLKYKFLKMEKEKLKRGGK